MAEPQVFEVVGGVVEQIGDVRVVQGVDDLPPAPLADDEAKVTQQAQLVRDRGQLHPNRRRKLPDRMGRLAQASEDQDPARRRERLHHHGHLLGDRPVDRAGVRFPPDSVSHRPA